MVSAKCPATKEALLTTPELESVQNTLLVEAW